MHLSGNSARNATAHFCEFPSSVNKNSQKQRAACPHASLHNSGYPHEVVPTLGSLLVLPRNLAIVTASLSSYCLLKLWNVLFCCRAVFPVFAFATEAYTLHLAAFLSSEIHSGSGSAPGDSAAKLACNLPPKLTCNCTSPFQTDSNLNMALFGGWKFGSSVCRTTHEHPIRDWQA